MKKIFLQGISALFLCSLCPFSAQASEHQVSSLTESNIRNFVNDVTDKANKVRRSSSPEAMSGFFSDHLHPNAFFKSSIRYIIPGFPQQENKITYNKDQYIDSLINTQQMAEDFSADVSIRNIQISSDKTKATIQTVTNESATMLVPSAGMTESVPMVGTSTCNQILMLNDERVIQIYSANCTTEMSFEDIY